MSDATPARFTLRQLPLPAKLVISVFLCAVGVGYLSALVQLHDKHSSKDGNPLPTPPDVIEVFSGLKLANPDAAPPSARAETLLTGDRAASDVSKDNMAPAFFAKSKGWVPALEAEREGERLAMLAWVKLTDAVAKKAAYEADKFPLPDELKNRPISSAFVTPARELKIQSLVNERCQNCHKNQPPELGTYAELESFVTAPSQELIDGKWVRGNRQTPKEKLIQSTHAHLLTFAILFSLTGFVTAFTGLPMLVRLVLSPIVLVAQLLDVSCWWLARIDAPYGPLFAQAIVGTGAVVGLGLSLQIVLGLFSLYDFKGKVVVALLLLGGGAGLGVVGLKVIQPALDAEKAEKAKQEAGQGETKRTDATAKGSEPVKKVDPPASDVSHLERLIMGSRDTAVAPWNGKGSMARAFFENESEFKKLLKAKSPELPKLEAEREGERLALQAWLRADPATRKKAYDEDQFPLPPALVGKPLTDEFAEGKGGVKVKSILNTRCVNCHADGAEQDKFPLETYEQILKYVEAKTFSGNIPLAKE